VPLVLPELKAAIGSIGRPIAAIHGYIEALNSACDPASAAARDAVAAYARSLSPDEILDEKFLVEFVNAVRVPDGPYLKISTATPDRFLWGLSVLETICARTDYMQDLVALQVQTIDRAMANGLADPIAGRYTGGVTLAMERLGASWGGGGGSPYFWFAKRTSQTSSLGLKVMIVSTLLHRLSPNEAAFTRSDVNEEWLPTAHDLLTNTLPPSRICSTRNAGSMLAIALGGSAKSLRKDLEAILADPDHRGTTDCGQQMAKRAVAAIGQ
jgi:hypothetical protein